MQQLLCRSLESCLVHRAVEHRDERARKGGRATRSARGPFLSTRRDDPPEAPRAKALTSQDAEGLLLLLLPQVQLPERVPHVTLAEGLLALVVEVANADERLEALVYIGRRQVARRARSGRPLVLCRKGRGLLGRPL